MLLITIIVWLPDELDFVGLQVLWKKLIQFKLQHALLLAVALAITVTSGRVERDEFAVSGFVFANDDLGDIEN